MEATKKKVKKTNVPVVELVYGGMLPVDVQKDVEKEFEMALQDRVMEETKEKKNAVEAYVYDMRNKVGTQAAYLLKDFFLFIQIYFKDCRMFMLILFLCM